MRYVKGLLLGVCLALTACGIGDDHLKISSCSMCSTAGPVLVIHLSPPASENVILELKRDNEKNIKIDCGRFLSPYQPPELGLDLNLPLPEPQGTCAIEWIAEVEKSSPERPTSKLAIHRFKVSFYSGLTPNFSNETDVEVSLKTQAGQMLAQQKFTPNYEALDNNYCGNGFPHCSRAEITLNLTAPDAETNNQEGAQ